MYRGVLLFGDSGAGKSSLINAALLPGLVREQFAPERLRVQPKPGAELIVERIPISDDASGPFLPSLFGGDTPRVAISAADLVSRVLQNRSGACPLLIFDQFEELITLSEQAVREGADPAAIRTAVEATTDALLTLLRRDDVPVKTLFVFREDYYAKLSRFFASYPNLAEHFLRLEPLRIDDLATIIRGPFQETRIFGKALPNEVMAGLEQEFRARTGTDFVSLAEVQIACLRLWFADDPRALLAAEHVNGLIEGYFSEATESIRPNLRGAAISILGRLVTSSGTRNVVSRDTLLAELEREGFDQRIVEATLEALADTAGVIRREARNDVVIYEVVSEFLVPWIMKRRSEEKFHSRERSWVRDVRVSVGVAAVAALALIWSLLIHPLSIDKLTKEVVDLKKQLADNARQNARLSEQSAETRAELLRIATQLRWLREENGQALSLAATIQRTHANDPRFTESKAFEDHIETEISRRRVEDVVLEDCERMVGEATRR